MNSSLRYALSYADNNHCMIIIMYTYNITKYGSTYYIGMAMVLSIIQYISKIQVSLSVCDPKTGMDRPHQNTHSIKKLANYMVGKGVKLNFHIVYLLLLLLL